MQTPADLRRPERHTPALHRPGTLLSPREAERPPPAFGPQSLHRQPALRQREVPPADIRAHTCTFGIHVGTPRRCPDTEADQPQTLAKQKQQPLPLQRPPSSYACTLFLVFAALTA